MKELKQNKISNHTELRFQIMQLNAEKEMCEEKVKRNLKEIYYLYNPASIIKNNLHKLAEDSEVRQDTKKIGMKLGAGFLIEKILGVSFKKSISSFIFRKISGFFIKKYSGRNSSGSINTEKNPVGSSNGKAGI